MKLVRLAIITLDPDPKEQLEGFGLRSDQTTVELSPISDVPQVKGTAMIAKAITPLETPVLDVDRFIAIPEEQRVLCETAITRAADLLAIKTRSGRRILSATPPAALIPENDADRELIHSSVAIRAKAPQSLSTFVAELDITSVLGALPDRWDGVALLAEAYSNRHMSGQYHEFVRFFELAFARSFMQMDRKLSSTLTPALGYTPAEIRSWQALRHPFTHADGKKCLEIAFEADARPIIQRMEQAVLDILFNKEEWRRWSSKRRDLWRPTAITVDPTGRGVVRQGSKPRLEFWLIDEFGVFPRDIHLQHTLPPEWYARFVPEDGQPKPSPNLAASEQVPL